MENCFLDFNRIISYGCFMNFIVAERGVGKTFGATDFVTNDFIKHNNEFVYVRRYKTELKKSVPKFFKPLIDNGKYKDHNFSNSSYETFKIDNKTCGYGCALTSAQSLKSVNYNKVKNIIFDEFIAEDGRYLSNEVHKFLSLIETIARMRDVRIFLLGNSSSITNPYFIEFNLELPYKKDIKLFRDNLIMVYYGKNLKYREEKKNTKFGKIIAGTSFSDFAIDNQFIFDNKNFIKKKTGSSKCRFAFSYQNQIYGVWFDYTNGFVFISTDYDKNVHVFATTIENHNPNTMLISVAKKYTCWRNLINNFNMGNLYFENQKIKNSAMEVIKMFVR